MTFPNHLVDHNRDFIVYDRLLLLSLQYGRPLSMFYESARLLISRHIAVAEIRFLRSLSNAVKAKRYRMSLLPFKAL